MKFRFNRMTVLKWTAVLVKAGLFVACSASSPSDAEQSTDKKPEASSTEKQAPSSGKESGGGESVQADAKPNDGDGDGKDSVSGKDSAEGEEKSASREPDVIFVPTPQEAVETMLEMADIKSGDVLYDLGCGDGRIVVTAAKEYGIKSVGIDIDPERVKEARKRVKENNVGDLVTIKQGDIFEADFSDADVVTLYLLPSLNRKLMPKLAKLEPGTRIVSYDFDMSGAKPEAVVESGEGTDWNGTIYKWVVPWEEEETEL